MVYGCNPTAPIILRPAMGSQRIPQSANLIGLGDHTSKAEAFRILNEFRASVKDKKWDILDLIAYAREGGWSDCKTSGGR